MNFLSVPSEPNEQVEKEVGSEPPATSVPQFFVAVLLLAAANAWNTVFTQAFEYYKPKNGAASVLIGSIFFSLLLTIIAITFARYYYNDEMEHHHSHQK